MADRVTRTSDPALWAALHAQWLQEHKPGHVTTGRKTYQVFILSRDPETGESRIEFSESSARSYYESTSF